MPVRWVVGPPLTASVKEVPACAVLFGLDKRLPELLASPAVGVGHDWTATFKGAEFRRN